MEEIPTSIDKDKKDKESTKDTKKDIWIPLPKDAAVKPLETKSFSDSLDELIGTKKAKPEADADRKQLEIADDEAKVEPLNHMAPIELKAYQPPAEHDRFIDLSLSDLTEGEVDLSADKLHERVQEAQTPEERPEQPENRERLLPRLEDVVETPPPVVEQPKPPEIPRVEASPPVVAESGVGGHEPPPRGPERPGVPEPELPPERPPLPPELPPTLRPELIQQAQAFDPNTSPASPPAESRSSVPPHRHPENDGAVIGLAAWETWRHHRMNKRNRKIHAKQEKRMKKIERAQAEARDQQYRTTIEQTQATHRLQQEVAARPTVGEIAAEQRRQPPAEHYRPAELSAQPAEKAAATMPEHVISQPIIEEEPVVLPPEHHLVRSEWHSIEVDKSGHPVEKPVFEYGREFQREQHQETRRQEEEATAELVGYSAVNTQMDNSQPTAPVSVIASPPAAQPVPTSTSGVVKSRRTPATDAVNIALWVALILIVLAIVAVLILR